MLELFALLTIAGVGLTVLAVLLVVGFFLKLTFPPALLPLALVGGLLKLLGFVAMAVIGLVLAPVSLRRLPGSGATRPGAPGSLRSGLGGSSCLASGPPEPLREASPAAREPPRVRPLPVEDRPPEGPSSVVRILTR